MDFQVRFMPSGKEVSVPAGTALLDAARQAGLPVANACGGGQHCALCGLEILEGEANLRSETDDEAHIKKLNRVDEDLRLSCQLEVTADLVVRAQYW